MKTVGRTTYLLVFTQTSDTAIPAWNIYGCLAPALLDHQSWSRSENHVCKERDVAIDFNIPFGRRSLDVDAAGEGAELVHYAMDHYRIPSVKFEIWKEDQAVVTGIVSSLDAGGGDVASA